LKKIVAVAAFSLALIGIGGAASSQQVFEMKRATNTLRDPTEEIIKEFKARIEEGSKGRIKAGLFPGSQLGNIPRMIEGVQLGTIEFYHTASAFWTAVNPAFQALDVPGLFENWSTRTRPSPTPR